MGLGFNVLGTHSLLQLSSTLKPSPIPPHEYIEGVWQGIVSWRYDHHYERRMHCKRRADL
jgi:hypothetical protein